MRLGDSKYDIEGLGPRASGYSPRTATFDTPWRFGNSTDPQNPFFSALRETVLPAINEMKRANGFFVTTVMNRHASPDVAFRQLEILTECRLEASLSTYVLERGFRIS